MWAQPAVAAYLLMEEDADVHRKRWVHPLNSCREQLGEYHHLMPQLRNDEARFVAYFRMYPALFDALHEKLEPFMKRRSVN